MLDRQLQVRRIVEQILDEESRDRPNWFIIERDSDRALEVIRLHDLRASIPDIVAFYLDDYDVRQRDERYSYRSRERVKTFLEAGVWPAAV